GVGGRLLAGCVPEAPERWAMLLDLERFPSSGARHGLLIAGACPLFEAALDRVLTEPARAVAGELIAALGQARSSRGQVEILEGWSSRGQPATIGTMGVILLALRRGLEQQRPAIQQFLAAHFQPRYADLLASKKLGQTLDAVRSNFRNRAAHTLAPFD